MSDMPMIIWIKPKCSSYYTARSVVDADIPNNKFVVAEESELDKYHHDSILQAKDKEIAELLSDKERHEELYSGLLLNTARMIFENDSLKSRIATLEKQIDLLPNGKVYSRRELEKRVEFLEKQLEGKIHDC